jgi:hypothetical protein
MNPDMHKSKQFEEVFQTIWISIKSERRVNRVKEYLVWINMRVSMTYVRT